MSKKEEKPGKVTTPAQIFACLDDKGENYLVEIELPGVSKKNIELNMHSDLIQVRAERENLTYIGHLHFPMKVDPKKAEAVFKQGLLAIKVPVKEKLGPPVSVKIK